MTPTELMWWAGAVAVCAASGAIVVVSVLFVVEVVRRFLKPDPLPLGIQLRPPA